MTAHYFLGSRLLGSTDLPQTWEGVGPTRSLAFFCSKCGDVWGRIAIDNRHWMVLTVGCERHPDYSFEPGGTFIRTWNHRALDEMPEAVLRREFALHWQHYTGIRP